MLFRSPLKLTRQLVKNIGREVEAVTFDGQKTIGELLAADEECITLRIPGTKKQAPQEVTLKRSDVKSVKVVLKF